MPKNEAAFISCHPLIDVVSFKTTKKIPLPIWMASTKSNNFFKKRGSLKKSILKVGLPKKLVLVTSKMMKKFYFIL